MKKTTKKTKTETKQTNAKPKVSVLQGDDGRIGLFVVF